MKANKDKGTSVGFTNSVKIAEEGEIYPLAGSGVEIGFICKICDGPQSVQYYSSYIFPVCDNCLKTLKEIILKHNHEYSMQRTKN